MPSLMDDMSYGAFATDVLMRWAGRYERRNLASSSACACGVAFDLEDRLPLLTFFFIFVNADTHCRHVAASFSHKGKCGKEWSQCESRCQQGAEKQNADVPKRRGEILRHPCSRHGSVSMILHRVSLQIQDLT